jgi:hypothetical protein
MVGARSFRLWQTATAGSRYASSVSLAVRISARRRHLAPVPVPGVHSKQAGQLSIIAILSGILQRVADGLLHHHRPPLGPQGLERLPAQTGAHSLNGAFVQSAFGWMDGGTDGLA